jgi:hypothetical protein
VSAIGVATQETPNMFGSMMVVAGILGVVVVVD